jgi:hypothetical protein
MHDTNKTNYEPIKKKCVCLTVGANRWLVSCFLAYTNSLLNPSLALEVELFIYLVNLETAKYLLLFRLSYVVSIYFIRCLGL